MRFVINILGIVSVLAILIPTLIGLIRTQASFAAQGEVYSDNGERYVLPPGRIIEREAESLVHAMFACCASTGTSTPAVAEWLEIAEMRGWLTAPLSAPRLAQLLPQPRDSHLIAELIRGGTSLPLLVLAADGRFVTAYEPGQGLVLYRLGSFHENWSGLALSVKAPAHWSSD